MTEKKLFFRAAYPVWFPGLEQEKNIHAGFRAVFPVIGEKTLRLRLTGSTMYRVFLNGEFVQHGPARGPHGFYRVDELDLSGRMKDGENLLAIEVVGVNCHSFAYLNQPSFLQAEIEADGTIVAATGCAGFKALRLPERIQKVERYSFQRPYVEAYRMAPGFDGWRKRMDAAFEPVPCTVQSKKELLPRGVALSDFKIMPAEKTARSGSVTVEEKPVDRSVFWWTGEPRYSGLKSFQPEEFELDVLQIIQSCSFTEDKTSGANSWQILDLGVNLTGFIQLAVSCEQPVRLMAVFDEVLIDGDLNLDRNKSINLIYYDLQPGTYELESMEPYTFRYLKLIALDGAVTVHRAGLREYANFEASAAEFVCSDPDLNLIFEAGRQTFRQNATDLYMDCPGRERAGWLCDSFFTGRVEPLLCGGSKVERNFIENFELPADFLPVPKGMLPMCYPSEHPDGCHIPQWAMWMVLELEEYLLRTGDRTMIDRMEPKIDGLLGYFEGFENSDGLLEKLPSWNFIEWSRANQLTEDVNYPTNMLYARMLESAARLYGKDERLQKARQVHQAVREQSFAGTFFVDNSVRDEKGFLHSSSESTEVCQYYAFFCGTASPESHPELWRILLREFGPNRDPEDPYRAVHPANAFIGYYLRMELLSRYGERKQLLHEIKGYFLSMAKTTGTLWEHNDTRASCNHGFASHICVHLIRDLAGIRTFDPVHRKIVLAEGKSLIGNVRCSLPAVPGTFELIEKDGVRTWHLPEGWTLEGYTGSESGAA
jgi:alpha-L-rhamnosidase